MPNDNDVELEYSPLCGSVTRDGLTVRVQIFRISGRGDGWSLEVIDHDDASTVWEKSFATDEMLTRSFSIRWRPKGSGRFPTTPMAGRAEEAHAVKSMLSHRWWRAPFFTEAIISVRVGTGLDGGSGTPTHTRGTDVDGANCNSVGHHVFAGNLWLIEAGSASP